MTTFLLIRHGEHRLGSATITGRATGVHLSDTGRAQAARLVERVGSVPIVAVYSSPMERCRETAGPLAGHLNVAVEVLEGLNEIDVGQWAGRTLAELDGLAGWRRWNALRAETRPPGGEPMARAQLRIVDEMLRLRERHPDECVALFSHGDIIRAAAAYFLGVPLDLFLRIEIGLASVSVIRLDEGGPRVLGLNNTRGEVAIA